MPSTYTLISSNVLSSSAASVTFSAIPSTYTDLVIRLSARTDTGAAYGSMSIEFNASGGTAYSQTRLRGNGTAASSNRTSSTSEINLTQTISGATSTSNTFGSGEIYIPSYSASQNKPVSNFAVGENNAVEGYNTVNAGLWSNTSAITQIKVTAAGDNFVSGSSFYLYGIKNS